MVASRQADERSADHPDIVRLQAQIAQLTQERDSAIKQNAQFVQQRAAAAAQIAKLTQQAERLGRCHRAAMSLVVQLQEQLDAATAVGMRDSSDSRC